MQNKLLPCPFCGGEASILKNGAGCYQVYCDNCETRQYAYAHKTKESAIKHWNTRKSMGDVASKVQQVIWDSCFGDEYKYASKEIEKIFNDVYMEGGVDNAG